MYRLVLVLIAVVFAVHDHKQNQIRQSPLNRANRVQEYLYGRGRSARSAKTAKGNSDYVSSSEPSVSNQRSTSDVVLLVKQRDERIQGGKLTVPDSTSTHQENDLKENRCNNDCNGTQNQINATQIKAKTKLFPFEKQSVSKSQTSPSLRLSLVQKDHPMPDSLADLVNIPTSNSNLNIQQSTAPPVLLSNVSRNVIDVMGDNEDVHDNQHTRLLARNRNSLSNSTSPFSSAAPKKISLHSWYLTSIKNITHILNLLSDQLIEIHTNDTSIVLDDILNNKYSSLMSPRALVLFEERPLCPASLCKNGHCYCDPQCLMYGDCCLEFLWNVTDNNITFIVDSTETLLEGKVNKIEQRKISYFRQYSKCVAIANDVFVLMVSACPKNYTDQHEVKRKCENTSEESIETFPVDFYDTNNLLVHVFQNAYCALCHGIDVGSLRFWKATVRCSKSIYTALNANDQFSKRFCKFHYHLPPVFRGTIRLCHYPDQWNKIFNKQSTVGEKESIDCAMCHRYINPLRINFVDRIQLGNRHHSDHFKNSHCFRCNNQSYVYTLGSCMTHVVVRPIQKGVTFGSDIHVLFAFNPTSGIQIKISSCKNDNRCQDYELYDCISKTCRVQYCPNGQLALKTRCRPLGSSIAVTHSSTDRIVFSPEGIFNDFDIYSPKRMDDTFGEKYFFFEIKTEADIPLGRNIMELEANISKHVTKILVDFEGISLIGPLKFNEPLIRRNKVHHTVLAMASWGKLSTVPFKSLLNATAVPTTRIADIHVTLGRLSIRNYINEGSLICPEGSAIRLASSEIRLENNTALVQPWGIPLSLDTFAFSITTYPSAGKKNASLVFCKGFSSVMNSKWNCVIIGFNSSEFLLTSNNSLLKLITSGFVYQKDEFMMVGKKAYVCASSLLDKDVAIYFNYSIPQRILSMTLTSISTVALITMLVRSISNPRSCNLHGLNLMALSVSLAFSQGLTFFNNIAKGLACIIVGAALHLLWLSVFTWMTIIGCNVAYTFLNPVKSLVTAGLGKQQTARFKRYILIGFGLPSIFVSICLTTDFTQERPIGYGLYGFCWITKPLAIFLAVTIPMTVSVSFNLLMLILSIYAIEKTKHETKLASTPGQRCLCLSYLKLTIFLGISWIFGVVAALTSVEVLWYIHIVFNGLQGLSIVLCYIYSTKMTRSEQSNRTTSS